MTRIVRTFLLAVLGLGFAGCANLQLAKNGTTEYVIVKPEKPTEVDDYAAQELSNFLKEKTGAEFPVVSPDLASPNNKYIFIGLSDPVKKKPWPRSAVAL